mmetsp:Transcript_28317/g.39856  ORF Transcript_28317/g.39856 Transcript_28317/m.39856 type:complete len:185 (+) Transcript_28317:112-666(+)
MKFSLVVAALAATSAAAFAPSAGERASTSLNMDRRAALGQFGVAAAVVATGLPQVANADGAISGASVNRARGTYGERIAGLKSAVDAGDFAAVAAEKTAFVLFNSGVYPTSKQKAGKKAAIAGTNKIFAAIKAKDSAALKSAYAEYVSTNAITALPAVDPNSGQGYSNDFDFRTRTRAGAIYVR